MVGQNAPSANFCLINGQKFGEQFLLKIHAPLFYIENWCVIEIGGSDKVSLRRRLRMMRLVQRQVRQSPLRDKLALLLLRKAAITIHNRNLAQ